MRVLITGGSGLLGQYLNIELSKRNHILTIYNHHRGNTSNFNSLKIDLTEFSLLEKAIKNFKPDIIIHTAAITSVEQATLMPKQKLFDININATGFIAEMCRAMNIKLIFTSTDLVYDGSEFIKKSESSKLNPISLYAESKILAEEKIIRSNCDYLILRVSLMFGYALNHSQNHFTTTIELLRNKQTVHLFDDQFRSQISLKEAAKIISYLLNSNNWKDTINLGGPERISRYSLVKRFAEFLNLNSKLIKPAKLSERENIIKVFDVSMNVEKLLTTLKKINSNYRISSIEEMFQEIGKH